MIHISSSPWSKGLKILTICATILLVISIAIIGVHLSTEITLVAKVADIVLIFILSVCLISSVCLSPRSVSSSEHDIIIHLVLGRIIILRKDIIKIEKFSDKPNKTIRIFGIGGFFGYVGLYHNTEIGRFSSYVTDFSRSFVIYCKNIRPIVVTVADSTVLD